MSEMIIALLMIINGEIKEARIQSSMSECLAGARVAKHSDIELCIRASLISPLIIISKAIIISDISDSHLL
jgi:hypothetical protein